MLINWLKKHVRTIILIAAALILIKITSDFFTNKIDKSKEEARREKIKNAVLVKEKEGLYSKIIADSLTKRQLKKINDSLKLELENPVVITNTVFKFKDKPTQEVTEVTELNDSILEFTDYYPSKEAYFSKYEASINKKNNEIQGKFSFSTLNLTMGIQDNKDGTFSVKTKLPEFLEIQSLESNAIPLRVEKKDNFGLLVGGGINMGSTAQSISVMGGFRIKKYNFLGEITSEGSLGVKVLVNF